MIHVVEVIVGLAINTLITTENNNNIGCDKKLIVSENIIKSTKPITPYAIHPTLFGIAE